MKVKIVKGLPFVTYCKYELKEVSIQHDSKIPSTPGKYTCHMRDHNRYPCI